MFAGLSKFIYRRRWFVLGAGVVFLIVAGVYGTSVFGKLKSGGFTDPAAESTKAGVAIHTELGRDETALIVLYTAKDGSNVDQPAYRQAVESSLAKINGQPGVGQVATYYTTGAAQLISLDKLSTYAVVGLNGNDEQRADYYKALKPLLSSDRLQVRLGGEPAINHDINEQVSKDLETAEILTFPVLAVLLVFIFGSLVASALPLALGGGAILGAFLILRIITNFADISIFALNVITLLGLGLAIDYSLFVVSRFREELTRHDGNVNAALSKTMQTAGRTVMFSGLTVVISLLSLLVFPQMFLKSMGLGGAAAVLVAMVLALTILPALLAVLGQRVNSLSVWSIVPGRRGRQAARQEGQGFWYRLSQMVMRRPALVLLATVIPLLLIGSPFLRANFSTADARSLPQGQESRVVSETLTNSFPRNETEPIQLVVRLDKPATDPASLSALYDYTRQVAAVADVQRIDSLVTLNPQMDKNAYLGFYAGANNPQAQGAVQRFAKGNYTTVSVLYASDPLSSRSQDIVRHIRSLNTPAGLSVGVGGNSALLVDFLSSLATYVPIAFGLVVVVIFVLLFLMLGSLVIPLKAVVLNIISLSVSFGTLVLIFQDGNLANILGFTPTGAVDGTQPVLIFAIAFGLSMDYEVFLLSRIKEHYNRTGDTTASVAYGIQKTGGIITSAALLLVVVIGGFATGEITFIKQIGVGLSLAVLVDATVVRALMVPASMRLLGKYNWWAPAPLRALYERLGLSEVEEEETPKTQERQPEIAQAMEQSVR